MKPPVFCYGLVKLLEYPGLSYTKGSVLFGFLRALQVPGSSGPRLLCFRKIWASVQIFMAYLKVTLHVHVFKGCVVIVSGGN